MDRHGKTGMLAVAGLISGFTLIAAYPYLQKSFHRIARRLVRVVTKSSGNNNDPITTTLKSNSSTVHDSKGTISPSILNTTEDVLGSCSDSDADSVETHSSSSNLSEKTKDYPKESVYPNELPKISKQVIDHLQTFNIFTETVTYQPVENRDNQDTTVYCKNLFLKDRKGKFYYFICREEKNIILRQLKYKLHAHRNFSFASPKEVFQHLNVQPGCITPFVFLSDDAPEDIVVAISRDLMFEKKLNFHPLHEKYATRISFGHLLKLFGHLQRKLSIIDL